MTKVRSSSRQYVDPVHNLIRIDDDLVIRFMEASEAELSRLGHCMNLALISEVYPSAKHTRLEHHLGMCHMALRLQSNPQDRQMLAVLSLARGYGHLPLGFVTEEAVLIAARLSSDVRTELETMMLPLAQTVAGKVKDEAENAFSKVLDGYLIKDLYKWISAYKFSALSGKPGNMSRDDAVVGLVSPSSHLYGLLQRLDEYDYVQRDLYHSGLARLQIHSDLLLEGTSASVYPDTAEARLFQATRAYLMDRLYCDGRVLWLESLTKKKIARAILRGDLSINSLLSMYDQQLLDQMNTWNASPDDLSLEDIKRKSSRVFTAVRLPARALRRVMSDSDLLTVESRITRQKESDLLSYPREKGFVISPKWINPREVSISILTEDTAMLDLKEVLTAASELMNIGHGIGAHLVRGSLRAEDIVSYLLGQPCRSRPSKVAAAIINAIHHAGPAGEAIISAACSKLTADSLWVRAFKDTEWLAQRVVDPVLWKDWAQLVPHLIPLLKKLEETANQNEIGVLHEVTVYLDTIHNLEPDCLRAWMLPGVQLGDKPGDEDREVDIITVKLFADRVVLEFVECTWGDGDTKALKDATKVNLLIDRVHAINRHPSLKAVGRVVGRSTIRDSFSSIDSIYAKYLDSEPKDG
jgi:HD superfamily phosphohydrolase